MKLPNLYVMILDILARVLERSHVIHRREIITSHDLASRAEQKCSIRHHDSRPAFDRRPQQIKRPHDRGANLTTVEEPEGTEGRHLGLTGERLELAHARARHGDIRPPKIAVKSS
jgi:hypothetical protein